MKTYRNYLGVNIFRVKTTIPGSDIRELKDGRMVECNPKYEVSYQFAGSYPYETLKECKESILTVFEKSKELVSKNEFIKIMNEE